MTNRQNSIPVDETFFEKTTPGFPTMTVGYIGTIKDVIHGEEISKLIFESGFEIDACPPQPHLSAGDRVEVDYLKMTIEKLKDGTS